MQGYYNDPPLYSPRQSYLRGSNDSKVTIFPDSDSGFRYVFKYERIILYFIFMNRYIMNMKMAL